MLGTSVTRNAEIRRGEVRVYHGMMHAVREITEMMNFFQEQRPQYRTDMHTNKQAICFHVKWKHDTAAVSPLDKS